MDVSRITKILAACALVLLLVAPNSASAVSGLVEQPQNQQTAPCYLAAMAALTKQGAIYSQGGVLANDPIDPATGAPYPRTGPDSFDCSGLVWWAYAQAGISVGQTTYSQLNNGTPINCTLADLAGANTRCWTLGDLIFLTYTGGQHVAIYVGSGKFMDCYNHTVGCILHDVTTDSFYAAHFYQARRIVTGCEGLTHDPGTPISAPPSGEIPDLEEIPALLTSIALVLPWHCQVCSDDGSTPSLVPLDDPEVSWYDVGSWFNWLAVQLWNRVALPIICWLLAMAQGVLNALSDAFSTLIAGINAFWRLGVRFIIWLRQVFLTAWDAVLWFRALAWQGWGWFATIPAVTLALLTILGQFAALGVVLVGQLVSMVLGIAQALVYLVALIMALVPALISAVMNPVAPSQLAAIANFFLLVWMREILQAIADSALGWVWAAFIALFYARFILWLVDEMSNLNG